MRRIIRLMCVVVAFSLVPVLPVYASTESNQRSSLFFAVYAAYIYKTDEDSYWACYDVTGTVGMDEIGAKSLEIQESDDGINWTTKRTYSAENYPQMICKNTGYHAWSFAQNATVGKCYRIKVVLWAKNYMGTGERAVYSDPVWF